METRLYSCTEIPAVMRVPELGEFLGIGRNGAYQLVRSGQVKALRIGRKIRIPRHAVLQFLGVSEQP